MERKAIFKDLLSFLKVLYLGTAKCRPLGKNIKGKHITSSNSSFSHNFRKCKEKIEDGSFHHKDVILVTQF